DAVVHAHPVVEPVVQQQAADPQVHVTRATLAVGREVGDEVVDGHVPAARGETVVGQRREQHQARVEQELLAHHVGGHHVEEVEAVVDAGGRGAGSTGGATRGWDVGGSSGAGRLGHVGIDQEPDVVVEMAPDYE